MKKLVILLIAVLLMCSVCITAFAAEVVSPETNTPTDVTEPQSPQTGVEFDAAAIALCAVGCMALCVGCCAAAKKVK